MEIKSRLREKADKYILAAENLASRGNIASSTIATRMALRCLNAEQQCIQKRMACNKYEDYE